MIWILVVAVCNILLDVRCLEHAFFPNDLLEFAIRHVCLFQSGAHCIGFLECACVDVCTHFCVFV